MDGTPSVRALASIGSAPSGLLAEIGRSTQRFTCLPQRLRPFALSGSLPIQSLFNSSPIVRSVVEELRHLLT